MTDLKDTSGDPSPPDTKGKRVPNAQFASRRREIVDLAAELFARNGYDATGIREIGDAAQLARGALYYYIDSKESLLSEIHDRVLDPLLESARQIVGMNDSATVRLRRLSDELIRQIIDHRDHVWVFLHEYRSLKGPRRETFRRKRAEFENCVLALLDAGMASGEFEIANPRMTMLAFLGMHNYTYQWAGRYQTADLAQLSQVYCDIFLRGIAPRPDGISPESHGDPT